MPTQSHTTANNLGVGGLVPTVYLFPGRGLFLEAPFSQKHSLSWPWYLGILWQRWAMVQIPG